MNEEDKQHNISFSEKTVHEIISKAAPVIRNDKRFTIKFASAG